MTAARRPRTPCVGRPSAARCASTAAKPFQERERRQQADAFDREAGLGGDAARVLEHRADVAKSAGIKCDDVGHLAPPDRP